MYLALIPYIVTGQVSTDSIRSIIRREVENKRSKSIVVGIIDSNGRHIFSAGKLSDDSDTMPNGNSVYEIGSITKVFTSLLLAEMGLKQQLAVTDPISKYLPRSVRTPIKDGEEISLLMLSTHRSGMPRFPYNRDPKNLDDPYADYTVDKLYEYISNFEAPAGLGQKWQYSNVGYGVLGNILTLVANEDYEQLLTERICAPLGMRSTDISKAKTGRNVAVGHAETGQRVGFTELAALEAGGAICSNTNDLLTFAAANVGLTSCDLLPAMEETHILQAKKEGEDTYATMGWTLSNYGGECILFKDGGTAGYRSFLGIDKKRKIGVVVLSNSNNMVTDIGRHILDPTFKIKPYKYTWAVLDTLRAAMRMVGVDSAIGLYKNLKSSKEVSFLFDEAQLNYLAIELRRQKKKKDALKICRLNVEEYPASVLAYESCGEMYRLNKDRKNAIKCFEKAIELDAGNPRWPYVIGKLRHR